MSEKVFPIDYQDYSNLVENDITKIISYQEKENIKFDLILGKLRNGIMGATIIANYFGLEMAIIEVENSIATMSLDNIYFPKSFKNKAKLQKLNVLFVDSICNSGDTISIVNNFFENNNLNINLVSYATLVNKNSKLLPTIYGTIIDKYIQTPWERKTFTPQSHLDRLENNLFKTALEHTLCIGINSEDCYLEVKSLLPQMNESNWYMIFHNNNEKRNTTSGISSYDLPKTMSLIQAKTIYKNAIKEKIDFIETHGLTHFIENNLEQAILLANKTPVCHIIFYEDSNFYKISVKEANKDYLFI